MLSSDANAVPLFTASALSGDCGDTMAAPYYATTTPSSYAVTGTYFAARLPLAVSQWKFHGMHRHPSPNEGPANQLHKALP